jgi:hypothetical protein
MVKEWGQEKKNRGMGRRLEAATRARGSRAKVSANCNLCSKLHVNCKYHHGTQVTLLAASVTPQRAQPRRLLPKQ